MKVWQSGRREFLGRVIRLLLLSGTLSALWAHAKLTRSEPKNLAVLRGSPPTIDLWFNELLDDNFNTIQVTRSGKSPDVRERSNLAKEKPQLDAKDRTHLSVKLPPLEPGTYDVEYRVLSRDGHTAPGRFSFTLLPKA